MDADADVLRRALLRVISHRKGDAGDRTPAGKVAPGIWRLPLHEVLAVSPVASWDAARLQAVVQRYQRHGVLRSVSPDEVEVNLAQMNRLRPEPTQWRFPQDGPERRRLLFEALRDRASGVPSAEIPHRILHDYVNPFRERIGLDLLYDLPHGRPRRTNEHPLEMALTHPLTFIAPTPDLRYPVGAPDPPAGVLVVVPKGDQAAEALWDVFWRLPLERGATRSEIQEMAGAPTPWGQRLGLTRRADIPAPALLRTFYVWFDTGYFPAYER